MTIYTPNSILSNLYRSIDLVKESIACYCTDPVSDFTRHRKLPVDTLIHYLIQNQSKAVRSELSQYFLNSSDIPSDSALCQQRSKLDPLALQRVLHLFTNSIHDYKIYKRYHLLACDGSDINIPFDAKDTGTYCQSGNNKPYSQFHLNALYDCLNNVFWDVSIDGASKKRECDALISMIQERNYPSSSIILCDRGYERYNLIAHMIESNQKFIIRVKDIYSTGILSTIDLPDGEFDQVIQKKITYKQTKETKGKNEYVHLINGSAPFDFLDRIDDHDKEYLMTFRAVRFQIKEESYECLITNLMEDEIDFEEFKELYHMRWREENGFRELKYNVGLVHFHSKKRMFLKQEILARIILFNLSNIVSSHIEIKQKKEWKHTMKINQSAALTNIRLFLNKMIDEKELILRIKKYLVPIRPDRKYKRNMKPKCVSPSTYRAS